MKRSSLLWTLLAGVLGAVGLTVFVSLSTDSAMVVTLHPVLPGARRSPPPEPMPLPDGPSPRALPLLAAPVVEPPDVAPLREVGSAVVSEGQIADLVRRLEEIEARRPLDFHHGAAEELLPFLTMEQEEGQRRAALDQVLSILDEWTLSPRVRGAVLALGGAWGGQSEVLARCSDQGESWRSTVIGLLCTDSVAGEPSALRLSITEFMRKAARPDVVMLPLELGRLPDDTLHAGLYGMASRLVEEADAWNSRNLAILALGTSIDERPDTLDLMTRLLFDGTHWGMQVRLPVCFVMAHARSDAAREVVLQFLEDPQVGDAGKDLVRWWLGDRPALPREVEVLAAPLRDPSASHIDKFTAVGSLLKRGGLTGPEGDAAIVDVLVDALQQETDSTLQLAMITTLAEIPGGSGRLAVLEDALRASPKMVMRLWAAKGLGQVAPGYEGQARSILHSARPDESAPKVLAAIDASLLALE